jgi:hypothetical protein
MTKTALRALLVSALSAAITLTTLAVTPASASGCGFSDPGVPGGWVATDCPADSDGGDGVQGQLDEERIGSYRCPDAQQVILSVNPDVCGYPAGVNRAPATTTDAAPAAVPTAAPGAGQQFQAPLADGTVAAPRNTGTASPAPAPATSVSSPFWVQLDKLIQMLKALLPAVFGGIG